MDAEGSLRHRFHELAETQQWVHHVVDLDSGEVRTTVLDRPVTPLSRAERLSGLGHRFDPSIFGGPAYRLTPRRPYQASPEASMIASRADVYRSDDDAVIWTPPRDFGTGAVLRGIRFFFAVSPNDRCLLSIAVSGKAFKDTLGHVRLQPSDTATSARIPIGDAFAAHSLDLTFVPLGGRPCNVLMSLEEGIELLRFSSVSFGASPPVINPF